MCVLTSKVVESSVKIRLLKYLTSNFFPALNDPVARKLLPFIRINENPVTTLSHKLSFGDQVQILWSDVPPEFCQRLTEKEIREHDIDAISNAIQPQDLSIQVLYEDDDLIFVNKPANQVVHGAPERSDHFRDTLINGLLHHYPLLKDLKHYRAHFRPGIVHRIDKQTSGVIVVAKTQRAFESLELQFQNHLNDRVYLALVHGLPEKRGTVTYRLAQSKKDKKMKIALHDNERRFGLDAVTHFTTLRSWPNPTLPISLVKFKLETGRQHQIRCHMKAYKNPIVNDKLYGIVFKDRRFREQFFPLEDGSSEEQSLANCHFLHAHSLRICHPITGESLKVHAPLPLHFHKAMCAFSTREDYW